MMSQSHSALSRGTEGTDRRRMTRRRRSAGAICDPRTFVFRMCRRVLRRPNARVDPYVRYQLGAEHHFEPEKGGEKEAKEGEKEEKKNLYTRNSGVSSHRGNSRVTALRPPLC